jgi:hypothetical protein
MIRPRRQERTVASQRIAAEPIESLAARDRAWFRCAHSLDGGDSFIWSIIRVTRERVCGELNLSNPIYS